MAMEPGGDLSEARSHNKVADSDRT